MMITLNAPAKINWFLNVFGKREDGYHDILSLMQCVSLSDTLIFEFSESLEVVTDAPVPLERNLVYLAARSLREFSRTNLGAKITLQKAIPIAAGLGGGSSDAAATLIGLNRFWNLGLSVDELTVPGAALGSDIPFFFRGPSALVEGRGDIIMPLHMRSYAVVLVKPPAEVSTAWAYKEIDEVPETCVRRRTGEPLTNKDINIKLLCSAFEKGDFLFLSSVLRNDFEPCVNRRHPVIGEIKEILLRSGALFSSMSGSGPTVFGVYEEFRDAEKAAQRMFPYWCKPAYTMAEKDEHVFYS